MDEITHVCRTKTSLRTVNHSENKCRSIQQTSTVIKTTLSFTKQSSTAAFTVSAEYQNEQNVIVKLMLVNYICIHVDLMIYKKGRGWVQSSSVPSVYRGAAYSDTAAVMSCSKRESVHE